MNSIVIPLALVLFFFYGLLRLVEWRLCRGRDAAEPPFVRARVPVVGHLMGLMRYGVSYYRMLRFVLSFIRISASSPLCFFFSVGEWRYGGRSVLIQKEREMR